MQNSKCIRVESVYVLYVVCSAFVNKFCVIDITPSASDLRFYVLSQAFTLIPHSAHPRVSKWRRRISAGNVIRIKRPKSNKIYLYQNTVTFEDRSLNAIYFKMNFFVDRRYTHFQLLHWRKMYLRIRCRCNFFLFVEITFELSNWRINKIILDAMK